MKFYGYLIVSSYLSKSVQELENVSVVFSRNIEYVQINLEGHPLL